MDIEDEAKKRIQEEINGKGIYISKSWDIRVVENFFKKLFGKSKKETEEKENGGHEENS